MENKQFFEVEFWKNLYKSRPDYKDFRFQDGQEKMKFFPDLINRKGKGLDLGCGLLSVFTGLSNQITAVDPLMDEYRAILDLPDNHIKADGENLLFKDKQFDYVFCVNVIDHTPSPEKMVSEIKRVLKNKGKLYFEVNFDDNLSPCHYELWNEELVNKYLSGFKLLEKHIERNNKDNQSLYHAIYENISVNSDI